MEGKLFLSSDFGKQQPNLQILNFVPERFLVSLSILKISQVSQANTDFAHYFCCENLTIGFVKQGTKECSN